LLNDFLTNQDGPHADECRVDYTTLTEVGPP
ncbi:MAG: hypothetical protein RLZZ170_1068, partial [Actinomycetota bacterium]